MREEDNGCLNQLQSGLKKNVFYTHSGAALGNGFQNQCFAQTPPVANKHIARACPIEPVRHEEVLSKRHKKR